MKYWIAFGFIFLHLQISAQKILIDRSKNQPVFPYDHGFAGISTFVDTLSKSGIQVGVNYQPLHEFLPALTNFDNTILFLTPAVFNPFLPSEINEIRNYVAKGGKLFIVAEHDNFFDHALNFNQLIRGTPITIQYNAIRVPSLNFIEAGWPNVSSAQIEGNFRFYLPAGLQLSDESKCICYTQENATPAKSCVAAFAEFGYGKILVVSDYELFWNMTPITGINYGDNKALAVKLIQKLFSQSSSIQERKAEKIKTSSGFKIAVDSRCQYLKNNFFIFQDYFKNNGIKLQFVDINQVNPEDYLAVISACEIADSIELNRYLQYKKIILLREAKTDFIQLTINSLNKLKKEVSTEMIDKQIQQFINTLQYKKDSSEAILMRKLGIELASGVLTDQMLNKPQITLKPDSNSKELTLKYCGYWNVKDSTFNNLLAIKSIYMPALYTAPPNPKAEFLINEAGEEKLYPILIANPKVLAFSAAASLHDQNFTPEIADKIVKWLKE